MPDVDDELRLRLLGETAKIGWNELQRFYASGRVITVAPGTDLIDVACCLAADNKELLDEYLQKDQVVRAEDSHAQRWHDEDSLVWAVVVAPWVLVQEV